jgi:hypothetical protein
MENKLVQEEARVAESEAGRQSLAKHLTEATAAISKLKVSRLHE